MIAYNLDLHDLEHRVKFLKLHFPEAKVTLDSSNLLSILQGPTGNDMEEFWWEIDKWYTRDRSVGQVREKVEAYESRRGNAKSPDAKKASGRNRWGR
jgi:hypothetical protein